MTYAIALARLRAANASIRWLPASRTFRVLAARPDGTMSIHQARTLCAAVALATS